MGGQATMQPLSGYTFRFTQNRVGLHGQRVAGVCLLMSTAGGACFLRLTNPSGTCAVLLTLSNCGWLCLAMLDVVLLSLLV